MKPARPSAVAERLLPGLRPTGSGTVGPGLTVVERAPHPPQQDGSVKPRASNQSAIPANTPSA